MSAANPKTQEPSMEEILASIRRIIADDQEGGKAAAPSAILQQPARAAPSPPPPPPPKIEDDVLDLAEIATPVPRPPSLDLGHDDIGYRDTPDIDFDSLAVEEPAPRASEPAFEAEPRERLLSTSADTTVTSSFNMLAHTVLTQNARTLEDLVKDMLRPMLKDWLDANLPNMVERLVRAEIERMTRGR
jgi:cell pole-organizing protein PopZ